MPAQHRAVQQLERGEPGHVRVQEGHPPQLLARDDAHPLQRPQPRARRRQLHQVHAVLHRQLPQLGQAPHPLGQRLQPHVLQLQRCELAQRGNRVGEAVQPVHGLQHQPAEGGELAHHLWEPLDAHEGPDLQRRQVRELRERVGQLRDAQGGVQGQLAEPRELPEPLGQVVEEEALQLEGVQATGSVPQPGGQPVDGRVLPDYELRQIAGQGGEEVRQAELIRAVALQGGQGGGEGEVRQADERRGLQLVPLLAGEGGEGGG